MIPRPTYDDANLILRLYEMRREDRMREGPRLVHRATSRSKTWDELQKLAPPGSDENASYRMVVTYWDMVASFITTGVLNKELFFQSGRELLVVWERMRDVLPAIREAYKDPQYWTTSSGSGSSTPRYMRAQSPDAYDAFCEAHRRVTRLLALDVDGTLLDSTAGARREPRRRSTRRRRGASTSWS